METNTNCQNALSVGSFDANGSAAYHPISLSNRHSDENWGFSLDELFKLALQFYKGSLTPLSKVDNAHF